MKSNKCAVCDKSKKRKELHKTLYKGKTICSSCSKVKVSERKGKGGFRG